MNELGLWVTIGGLATASAVLLIRPLARYGTPGAPFVATLPAVLALGVYLLIGTPQLPDSPLAGRGDGDPAASELRDAVRRLEAHLSTAPDDARGWVMLARTYRGLGRLVPAATAFANAVRAVGGPGEAGADLLADYGEAHVAASDGIVTPEALSAFRSSLADDPAHPKAWHYVALAHLQTGDRTRALALWRGLEAAAPADAPWLAVLRQRIAGLTEELGNKARGVRPAKPNGSPPGPTAEEIRAAEALAPEERDRMIRGMVDSLAERLQREPDDAAGWLRLGRSYRVLGETDKAMGAFGQARDWASPGSAIRSEAEKALAGPTR